MSFYAGFEPKGASDGLPPLRDIAEWLDSLAPYPAFLAEQAGRIVGHGILCPEKDRAELAVFVGQEFRGLGLGRALMQQMIALARRTGLRMEWGQTHPDNAPMMRLALKLGFVAESDQREFHMPLSPAAEAP